MRRHDKLYQDDIFHISIHYFKFWMINQVITLTMSIFYFWKMRTLSVEKRLLAVREYRSKMAIFELFSKRQKKLRGEVPDVYQYENIDQSFRVQFVHIVRDTIGVEQNYNEATNGVYREIHKVLCKEYGVFTLKEHEYSNFSAVYDYFLNQKNHEKCLDIIELTFRIIDTYVRDQRVGFS
ncbi:hypothetical protein P4S72_13120 [Vibrio sp. PP-XX7]